MGRGKSAMKDEDYLVLRACRWRWWATYLSYLMGNTMHHTQHISFDKYLIYQTLSAGMGKGWRLGPNSMSEDQIYYRMVKLADRGYLSKHSRGAFKLTETADPATKDIIESVQQEAKDRQERDMDLIQGLGEMVDRLIPGHGISVSSHYGQRVLGYPMLGIYGPGHQLRMLLRWAEQHVKAMDAAALAAEEARE